MPGVDFDREPLRTYLANWLPVYMMPQGMATRLKQDTRQEPYDVLGPVYDGFAEGFDSASLKNAKVLLDKLS